jgi:hypothetical protein
MVTAVIKTRTEAMRAVSQVLAQAIPLERQAFSLDKDGGERVAPTYMAPDYDKPKESGLSE